MKSETTKEGFSLVVTSGDVSIARALSMQAEANKERIGGFDDWLLPDSLTLLALFRAASELRNGRIYWSSTTPPRVNAFVGVYVSSDSGLIGGFDESGRAGVMLVRHKQFQDIGRDGHIASMRDAGI